MWKYVAVTLSLSIATATWADERQQVDLETAAPELAVAFVCLSNLGEADLFEIVFQRFSAAVQVEMADAAPEQLQEELRQVRERAYTSEPVEGDDNVWRLLCATLREKLLPE